MTMYRIALLMRDVAEVIHRHADGAARVDGIHAAHHAVSWQHRHRAHPAFAEMLLHFGDDIDWIRHIETVGSDPQRLINRRQMSLAKFDVDDRTDDLHDFADAALRAITVGRSHIY